MQVVLNCANLGHTFAETVLHRKGDFDWEGMSRDERTAKEHIGVPPLSNHVFDSPPQDFHTFSNCQSIATFRIPLEWYTPRPHIDRA